MDKNTENECALDVPAHVHHRLDPWKNAYPNGSPKEESGLAATEGWIGRNRRGRERAPAMELPLACHLRCDAGPMALPQRSVPSMQERRWDPSSTVVRMTHGGESDLA